MLRLNPSIFHIINLISITFRYKSWSDIYNYIKNNESNSLESLKSLKEAAKAVAGDDQPDEVVEDAAVMLLRMFLDQDIVMLKNLSELRQTFGPVTSSAANKCCEVS